MADSSDDGDSNSNQQGNAAQDKNWEWIACVYDMKRSTADSEITWNLSPSIMLTLPSEQNYQPKVDLIIESSKQFIFSEDLQWNWHKSWNIPDIHCTLDIRDPSTNEKLLPPSKIYAEIYVVRAVINQIHTFHLVDVGIKGDNRSEFESSRCVFTGLKFDTTSYNHEGSKFHLVIVVYLNQNKFEHPKILESRISPPIFVDSRKSARDTQQQKAQKLSSFIDPFLPDSLDKKFVKRESKKKSNADESIDNTIEGLTREMDIRNHLCHFKKNNEKFVEVMQKQLMEAYNRSSQNTNMDIEDKPLILTIEHSQQTQNFKQKKQISEFLDPLHGDVLHVMIDTMSIPSNFKKLEDIEGVKEAYKKVYSKISQQKFSNSGDDEESAAPKKKRKGKQEKEGNKNKKKDESDGSDEDEEQEEAQINKKIKPNEADSSQVNQVFDSKKMQIKNPAQQSEIVLNSTTSNNANVTNMILQGAKPTQSKVQKPGSSENDQIAPSPQITSKTDISNASKATKGKGKRVSKNTQGVSTQNESTSQQQIPLSTQQSQQPIISGQIEAQNQNLKGQRQQDQKPIANGFPTQSLNQGIDPQQRQLSQTKNPGQMPSFPSQSTYPQPQIPPQAGFGGAHLNNSRLEFDNTLKPINAIQGGYQFSQQGYYPQGQHIVGNEVGFNGMIPGSQQSYVHHLSQQNHGYPQPQHSFSGSQFQLPTSINGSLPQQQQQQQYILGKHPSMQNLQQPSQGTKEIYDDQAGVNLPTSYKQPGLGQETAPTVPESNDQTKSLTRSAAHQQYPVSHPAIQSSSQSNQFGAVQQQQGQPLPPFSDPQYPRTSSQSFTNISQQTRFPPGLPSKASIGSLNTSIQQQPSLQQGQSHFYDQQGVNPANHFVPPNPEQTGQYLNGYNGQYQMPSQLNAHPNGSYPDDEDPFNYQGSQFNRFQAGQQQQPQHGGQMPYNQGVASHDGQFGYYGYQQQQHQAVPGHPYGYNQQNLDGFQAGDHPGQQMQYFKQGINPQFQQYYPPQQQQAPMQPLDLQNPLPPQSQQYPQGDSNRAYYLPSNGKEDEF